MFENRRLWIAIAGVVLVALAGWWFLGRSGGEGGEIRVESTVGEGSTFYLTLPVCEDSGDSEENGESA